MKQKVGLTCALIHTPKILLLDEPTNGVDPVSRRDFWKILYELQREKVTVMMATTYLDEADRCHRVAIFDRGRARLVMSPVEMRGLLPGQFYQLHTRDRRRAVEVLRNHGRRQESRNHGARRPVRTRHGGRSGYGRQRA